VVIGAKQQEQVLHTGLQGNKISFILTESSIKKTLNYDIKVRLTVVFVVSVWTAENTANKKMEGEKARELIVKRPR
jgi:hypothetical protein